LFLLNSTREKPAELAREVLAEIPDQLIEYMRLNGVKPKPPQQTDISKIVPKTRDVIMQNTGLVNMGMHVVGNQLGQMGINPNGMGLGSNIPSFQPQILQNNAPGLNLAPGVQQLNDEDRMQIESQLNLGYEQPNNPTNTSSVKFHLNFDQ